MSDGQPDGEDRVLQTGGPTGSDSLGSGAEPGSEPAPYDYAIRHPRAEVIQVQDLTVEDGRGFLRMLQNRKVKYEDHPMREPVERGLKPHYIHGCGRAVRSFSTKSPNTSAMGASQR